MSQESKEKTDFDLVYVEAAQFLGFSEAEDMSTRDRDSITTTSREISELLPGTCLDNVIHHPYHDAWVESDFAEIAKIRKLGRFLIDDTKKRLVDLGTYETGMDAVELAMHYRARDWYEAHPNVTFSQEYGRAPESVLPKNIAEFPHGEYVGCLGISIGMTALAELHDIDFIYASELRDSSAEFMRNFRGINEKIKRQHPGAYDFEKLSHLSIQIFDLFEGKNAKPYAGMPVVNPKIFNEYSSQDLRDYHHFLLTNQESEDGKWSFAMQIDPYNLIFKEHDMSPYELTVLQKTLEPGSVYIAHDDLVDRTYEVLNIYLDEMTELTRSFQRTSGKKPDQFEDIVLQTNRCIYPLYKTAGHSDPEKSANSLTSAVLQRVLLAQNLALAKQMGLDAERSNMLSCIREQKYTELWDMSDLVVETYTKRKHQEKVLRRFNESLREQIPIATFTLLHRHIVQSWFGIRASGPPNKSAEIGETDFTIGSMFLNHYANYRKDGRINVARYLSRYTSSQLIWLAAMCDGESGEDPSMQAVGEQVKRLQPSEMHPRVHLVVKK